MVVGWGKMGGVVVIVWGFAGAGAGAGAGLCGW